MKKEERNGNTISVRYLHVLYNIHLCFTPEFDAILVLEETFYQFIERLKQRNLRAVDALKRAKKDLEFLEINFIDQNTYLNELTHLNTMLRKCNKDLSKKLRLCAVDKERIQRNLTNQLNEAASAAEVSSISKIAKGVWSFSKGSPEQGRMQAQTSLYK